MATYYWVGGAGNWDSSNSTHWSLSSGGSGFAGVPTSADNVIFDANSASGSDFTASILGSAVCYNLTVSRPTTYTLTLSGTPAVSGPTISIGAAGSTGITCYLGLTCSYNGVGTLLCSPTMSGSIVFSGSLSSWTLGSNLTCGSLTIAGSFSTSASNYAVSCSIFDISNSNTRTISLNASSVTCSTRFDATTSTNLTMNAGTSTIYTKIFYGGGKTYNKLQVTNLNQDAIIRGANTFSLISFGGETRYGYSSIVDVFFDSNQTIGTLSLNVGNASSIGRQRIRSSTGSVITLTVTTFSAAQDLDFYLITIAGPAAPISGTRFGDCGGNTGVVFPAAKTVYWNKSAGGYWDEYVWALSPGGTVAMANFPLAQDTAVFATTGLNYNGLITSSKSFSIGTLDTSARTSSYAMRFDVFGIVQYIFGNWISGSGLTLYPTFLLQFMGVSNTTITTGGINFCSIYIQKSSGASVALQSDLNTALYDYKAIRLDSGTFALNGFTAYVNSVASSNVYLSLSRTLAIGSGTLVLKDGNGTFSSDTTLPIITATTGKISIQTNAAATFTISNGITFPCPISIDTGCTVTFVNNNTLSTLINTVDNATVKFTAGTTTTFTGDFALLNICTVSCVTASTYTLSKATGTVVVRSCTISGSNATGGATWLAPTSGGNVDAGSNTGWVFTATNNYSSAVIEAPTTVDSPSAGLTYDSFVVENNQVAEVNTASKAYAVTVVEAQTVTQTDAVSDYWTVINTTQSPNWTPVVTI